MRTQDDMRHIARRIVQLAQDNFGPFVSLLSLMPENEYKKMPSGGFICVYDDVRGSLLAQASFGERSEIDDVYSYSCIRQKTGLGKDIRIGGLVVACDGLGKDADPLFCFELLCETGMILPEERRAVLKAVGISGIEAEYEECLFPLD